MRQRGESTPMATFEEVYKRLLLASAENRTREELARLAASNYDRRQLDCLLHPELHPAVCRVEPCACDPGKREACAGECPAGAMGTDGEGVTIDPAACLGCGECVGKCGAGSLAPSKDAVAVLESLRGGKRLAYALVAPAFIGQFGEEVTPGRLRTALKRMGFDGMIEVAVFADILTLKEALEFDRNIRSESDYQLTSCCCPMWIGMIRKVYSRLMPHIPPSVSPMIACGRTVKLLHPDSLTVFIGPCVAKKAEAREADLKGAVDYVVTFQEMRDIFSALGIAPAGLPESEREFSSRAGRIYARAGGVGEAVATTLERLNPKREIAIKVQRADGVPACRSMLDALLAGRREANFYEGMGCVGGCVGGPKALIDKAVAAERVGGYGDSAVYPTPIDNPYVVELLHRLGFDAPEDLLADKAIFARNFSGTA